MQLQVVTISVSNLERARQFYENKLGFDPDIFYEPTKWQSYKLEGNGGFGIAEVGHISRSASADIINFVVSDVESLWQRVKDLVEIESALQMMPWGTSKFVVLDPDGFRLGFVGEHAT